MAIERVNVAGAVPPAALRESQLPALDAEAVKLTPFGLLLTDRLPVGAAPPMVYASDMAAGAAVSVVEGGVEPTYSVTGTFTLAIDSHSLMVTSPE